MRAVPRPRANDALAASDNEKAAFRARMQSALMESAGRHGGTADANLASREGTTALMLASSRGLDTIAAKLIASGANVNAQNTVRKQ